MTMNNNFADIPIDPVSLNSQIKEAILHPDAFAEHHPGIKTNALWIRNETFAVLFEIARLIHEGTDFQRKSRIVLEYDPRSEKFAVVTIMQSDESEHQEASGTDESNLPHS